MSDPMVQRRGNARATGGATGWATPGQRRGNEGATLSPYPYGVAPAFEGGASAYEKRAEHLSAPCLSGSFLIGLGIRGGEAHELSRAKRRAKPKPSCKVSHAPFGSFRACRVYGAARRLSFSVAGFENRATIATPQRVRGNEMNERVSRAEAARQVGVSPATITRLVQSHPELLDDEGRVSIAEVNEVRKVGRLAVERPRVRSDNAKAEMAEMDLAKRQAKTLRRADVEAALAMSGDILRKTAFALTRDRVEALTRISDPREMERALEDLMRDFLQQGVQALTQAADGTKGIHTKGDSIARDYQD